MSQIIVDATFASQLSSVRAPVEVVDPSGNVIGDYLPRVRIEELQFLVPFASEEELERRENSGERRYSMAEVRERLRSL